MVLPLHSKLLVQFQELVEIIDINIVFETELELERELGRVNYVIVMPIACKYI